MRQSSVLLVLAAAAMTVAQRPPFAGSKPIGYPEITTESLQDRFGEVDGTTQRLPLEANGDQELVDRLSKLPIDKQPFWLINWQALEANRQKPQTYPQRPNPFIDPILNGAANSVSNTPSNASSNTNIGTENRFGTDDKKPQTSGPKETQSQNASSVPNTNKVVPSTGNNIHKVSYHHKKNNL